MSRRPLPRSYNAITTMLLYHGSDIAIEHPLASLNTGFSDLGHGFYLTDDPVAAKGRARTRARRMGAGEGVVSVFSFDEDCLPWASWGDRPPTLPKDVPEGAYGLRFEATAAGIAAWAAYIGSCRAGDTAVAGLGVPAVTRAWIATEEIEMVYAGFAEPQDLADILDPSELVVQYCFADQRVLDAHLHFVRAE